MKVFELTVVQSERQGSSFSCLHADIQFSQHNLLKRLFSIKCFEHLCQKSDGCSCMHLCLDILFCSIGLHMCFCASTMLFLFLWLCSIVWSQVLWHLQYCSFCSVLHWPVMVFCGFIWTLMLNYQSLWGMSVEFWWGMCLNI
jgi:hypothetical protein